MTLHYADDRATIYHGDCIEVMRTLPDNSVDAVVTDPPYGLSFMGKDWDNGGKMLGQMATGDEQRGGFAYGGSHDRGYADNDTLGFQAFSHLWATEALRVLKPGGHLLAFGGTRTWHRLAVAIEDAGFEVRDSIAWMYGSGFPKSHDVSKGIDRKRDDTEDINRVVRWLESRRQESGVTRSQVEQHFGTQNIGQSLFTITSGSASRVATWDQWLQLKTLLQFDESMDAEVWRLNGRKGTPGEAWAERQVVGKYETDMGGLGGERLGTAGGNITAPATPAAQQWQGWGTALKPAHEPIVVARKPLIGTVAANVLTHGTGALNIDGCRIGTEGGTKGGEFPKGESKTAYGDGLNGNKKAQPLNAGRWPANVILDESQAAALDAQSGVGVSVKRSPTGRAILDVEAGWNTNSMTDSTERGFSDSGGASRFFYIAKASSSERPVEDGIAHPTVKPLRLMEYLCRLVTPPGGTILEPFAGSGTTIEAALNEGFNVIGIEMTDEYLPLIIERIERYGEKLW